MKNTIIYIIGLIMTFYLIIMYDAVYLYHIFWGGIILLLLCGIQAIYTGRRTEIRITGTSSGVKAGEPIGIRIQLENNSRIPIYFLRVKLSYQNELNREEAVKWVKIYPGGKRKAEVSIHLQSSYCGIICIKLKKIETSDYLRLIRFPLKLSGETKIFILPEIKYIPLTLSNAIYQFEADGTEYSKEISGDDPSEVFDIREYRAGDRMQRVHWKITAKSEDYVVKEFSKPEGYPLVLFLDLSADIPEPERLHRTHQLIEIAASLSGSLLAENCAHYFAWCGEHMDILRMGVCCEEELYAALGIILGLQPYQYQTPKNWEDMYADQYGKGSCVKFISITLTAELRAEGMTMCRIESLSSLHLEL